MAFDKKSLDDYVDVATRIAEFRSRHPEGCLAPLDPAVPYRVEQVQGYARDGQPVAQTFISVVAAAWRSPDDPRPGVGMAWEVFPGRTPYTLGSELMNAETSAWGRAIIAVLAADSRAGVASAEEVRNRQAERDVPVNRDGSVARSQLTDEERHQAGIMTSGEVKEHGQLRKLDHPRPADRTAGPRPDDEWTADEVKAGTSTLEQQQQIAIRLDSRGITGREAKLAFCTHATGRLVKSSAELSYLEAAEILRRADALPAAEKKGS
jgi:hypothetical protein